MNTTELRALAEMLEHECALRLIAGGKNHEEAQACEQAANYLRACADNQPYETERWNVERQSDGSLLVCFNRHERGEKCEYEHFVPAPAAPQAERPPTCLWSRADDDTDMWETTCGKAFTIIDGSPADNQMAFCCYCGRELESETGDSDADN